MIIKTSRTSFDFTPILPFSEDQPKGYLECKIKLMIEGLILVAFYILLFKKKNFFNLFVYLFWKFHLCFVVSVREIKPQQRPHIYRHQRH